MSNERPLLSGLVLMLAVAGVWTDLHGQEVDLTGTWTGGRPGYDG